MTTIGTFGLLSIASNAGGDIVIGSASPEAAGALLMTESGISAQLKRASRGLAMLEKPSTEWTAYEAELAKIATAHGTSVKSDYDLLLAAGYSQDIAERVAKEKNTRAFLDSKHLLEINYPYANDLNILAGATAKMSFPVEIPGLKSGYAKQVNEKQTKRRRKLKNK